MSPKGKRSLPNRIQVGSPPWVKEYFSRPCQRLWGVVLRGAVAEAVAVFVALVVASGPIMAIGRTTLKSDCSIKSTTVVMTVNLRFALVTQVLFYL